MVQRRSWTDSDRHALVALGTACRQFREQQGLSVTHVAKTARIAPARLIDLEHGRLDAGLSLLTRVAQSIGVRLSAIVARADELERRSPP